MDIRARMRVLSGGFYFSPAWYGHQRKTKSVIMEETGLFAAVTKEMATFYRLKDCQYVGKTPVSAQTWSAAAIPRSSLFVTANGGRSYTLWEATAGVEAFTGVGVAQMRNVVADDLNVFSIEGIRNNLNFLRVDPVALALAKEGSAMLGQKLR